MKRLFLYRLSRHSIPAFAVILLFIICYAVVFYKKMDMTFFPYNSMYSIGFTKTNSASTYGMKINGSRIDITDHLYWKKDFLETSLYGYCKYIRNQQTVFVGQYLQQKFPGTGMRNILLPALTPGKNEALNWPRWYANFAGYPFPANATMELWQYDFLYENGKAILTDSTGIYKTILP